MRSTEHGPQGQDWATEPIAVTGLSCKLAGDASDAENLWSILAKERDAWSEIPPSRFDLKGAYHADPDRLGTMHVKGGYFVKEDVAKFDAAFFNLSGETAAAIDPQYRMQLESVYEAFENAGLPLSRVAGSNTSVYAGIWTHDYHDGLMQDGDKLPRFLIIGTPSALAANRISHFSDLRDASLTLDTGCSSGLVALYQAVLGLRAGKADMAFVSGCNLILSPDRFKILLSLGMLSPDGRSYAFNTRANGYGRGEGVVNIIIKRLRDALAAGDPARAIIREKRLNQDGKTNTIIIPSEAAQTKLMRECYRRAGLSPRDTQVFKVHGTGTPAGDPIEARAIAAVFESNTGRTRPLHIGSIKTNVGKDLKSITVGYTEAASGLAGLVKIMLAMEKGQIPASVNYDKPNPKLELDKWGLRVVC